MKDDDRLFKYLEDSIYSAHPKEYWMGEWEKKLNAGYYDYVDDELTGVKAFTMIKAETAQCIGERSVVFLEKSTKY